MWLKQSFAVFGALASVSGLAANLVSTEVLSVSDAIERGIEIEINEDRWVTDVTVALSDRFSCAVKEISAGTITEKGLTIFFADIPTDSRRFEFQVRNENLDGVVLSLKCANPDSVENFRRYEIQFSR